MKRSEMIKKMSEHLILNLPIALTEEESTECADVLLKFVEDEGMLPPYSSSEFYAKWVGERDSDGGYSWEKE